MKIPRALRSSVLALAASLALLAGGPAHADDDVDGFRDDLQAALDLVGDAAQGVLDAGLGGDGDRLLDAALSLADAAQLEASLLTRVQSDPVKSALGKKAAKMRGEIVKFTKATAKSLAPLGKALLAGDTSAKKLKSILAKLKAANKAGLSAARRLSDLPGSGFTLAEVGNAAGFHKPGAVVTYRLVQNPFGPPCAGPFQVTVTDQFGAPVTTDPHTFPVQDPSRPFTVTMGTAGGGARVVVTGCSASSSRLLFNYGAFGRINSSPFRLQPRDLPRGSVSDFGLPYLEYVDAVGGTDPCVWTASGLPPGYSLQTVSSGTGISAATVGISGFPWTTPGVVGAFPVTITGTDARGRVTSLVYTLTIDP